jgi:hypothetical protein
MYAEDTMLSFFYLNHNYMIVFSHMAFDDLVEVKDWAIICAMRVKSIFLKYKI